MKRHRIVAVRWEDAQTFRGRHSEEDATARSVASVLSLGFLVRKNARVVAVAQGRAEDGEFLNVQAIPRTWVRAVKTVGYGITKPSPNGPQIRLLGSDGQRGPRSTHRKHGSGTSARTRSGAGDK